MAVFGTVAAAIMMLQARTSSSNKDQYRMWQDRDDMESWPFPKPRNFITRPLCWMNVIRLKYRKAPRPTRTNGTGIAVYTQYAYIRTHLLTLSTAVAKPN